jgi:hypothetical protein
MNAARASWKGLEERKIQNHIEVHIDRHPRKVAQAVERYMEKQRIPYLVIGSHRELTERFSRFLPRAFQKKIVGDYHTRTDQSLKRIQEKSLEVIARYDRLREEESMSTTLPIDQLSQLRPPSPERDNFKRSVLLLFAMRRVSLVLGALLAAATLLGFVRSAAADAAGGRCAAMRQRLVTGGGSSSGLYVIDAESGRTVCARAAERPRPHADVAAVGRDDARADGEAEAGAVGPGREERVEDPLP